MSKITVVAETANNAAIAADAARTGLLMRVARGTPPCRWSPNATYTEANSQELEEGILYTVGTPFLTSVISFKGGPTGTVVETTVLP